MICINPNKCQVWKAPSEKSPDFKTFDFFIWQLLFIVILFIIVAINEKITLQLSVNIRNQSNRKS